MTRYRVPAGKECWHYKTWPALAHNDGDGRIHHPRSVREVVYDESERTPLTGCAWKAAVTFYGFNLPNNLGYVIFAKDDVTVEP